SAPFAEDFEDAEGVARLGELQTHQQHQAEAEEEEAQRGHAVLDADPLVVDGEDVLAEERLLVAVTVLGLFFLADAHRIAEQPLRVIRVEPLLAYPELPSRWCHSSCPRTLELPLERERDLFLLFRADGDLLLLLAVLLVP